MNRTSKIAARVIQWTLAILACCCGDLWASWLVIDALQDLDDE